MADQQQPSCDRTPTPSATPPIRTSQEKLPGNRSKPSSKLSSRQSREKMKSGRAAGSDRQSDRKKKKKKTKRSKGSKRGKERASAEKLDFPEADYEPAPAVPRPPVAQSKSQTTVDNNTVKKMEDRVQKKKKAEKEKTQDEREENKSAKLKPGDEAFPKYDTLKTAEAGGQLSQFKPVEDLTSMKPASYLAQIRTKVKNKDNKGDLFWDGNNGRKKPFWRKPRGEPVDEESEELPVTRVFNGETILAVTHGLFQLPAKKDEGWRKDCDPYARLSSLEEKDQTAFSNMALLGNTVRSMLNVDRPTTPEVTATELNQRLIQEKRFFEKKEREADAFVHGTVRINEPTMALHYNSTRTQGYEVPFKHVKDGRYPPKFRLPLYDNDCDSQ